MTVDAAPPPSPRSDRDFVLRAEVGSTCLWMADGSEREPSAAGLTDRLVDALHDWAAFFDEVGGVLEGADVTHEFVSQGYKVAHKLRGELKGSRVHFVHPESGESEEIVRRGPR